MNINECYLDFVNKILKKGTETYKDSNHHLRESLGNHYFIEDPLGLKFKIKYKNVTSKSMLEDIKSGRFDMAGNPIKSDALYEYVSSFDVEDDSDFVYTYSNRILDHFGINQFDNMKNRLLEAVGSNRAVSVTYDPKIDFNREHIPCLQIVQAIVRDGKLTIHCFFRSNDIFGAFYSNMYYITYMGIKLVEELNKDIINNDIMFGGIHYYSSSAHIYNNDLRAAKKLIKKNKEVFK